MRIRIIAIALIIATILACENEDNDNGGGARLEDCPTSEWVLEENPNATMLLEEDSDTW